MRYLKVLLLVALFFVSMVFFFQNQALLSTEMALNLNLFVIEPMQSIPLPFYLLVLGAFVLGALIALLALVWDKMHLSAKHMRATWRVRALEKEIVMMRAEQEKAEQERLALAEAVQDLVDSDQEEKEEQEALAAAQRKEESATEEEHTVEHNAQDCKDCSPTQEEPQIDEEQKEHVSQNEEAQAPDLAKK